MQIKKRFFPFGRSLCFVSAILSMLLLESLNFSPLYAQADCRQDLQEAQRLYAEVAFEEAIVVLRRCLAKPGIPNAQKVQAYELLGNCFVTLGDTVRTKAAIDILLKTNPIYDPEANPLNPSTTIPIAIPAAAEIELKIYNLLGQQVKAVFTGAIEAGEFTFTWNGRDDFGKAVASGVYVYRLTTSSGMSMGQRMVLMR